MILTDREIEIALNNDQILITPRPKQAAFSSTTLDLSLSNRFAEWAALPGVPINPGAPEYSYSKLEGVLQKKFAAETYTLNPGKFVLAWTVEEVTLPIISRIAARVEGKSSLARLGVGIHVTAPTIHSGFSGNVQLEVFNNGPNQIILSAGMSICQLVFEQTYGTPLKGYTGMFVGQKPD